MCFTECYNPTCYNVVWKHNCLSKYKNKSWWILSAFFFFSDKHMISEPYQSDKYDCILILTLISEHLDLKQLCSEKIHDLKGNGYGSTSFDNFACFILLSMARTCSWVLSALSQRWWNALLHCTGINQKHVKKNTFVLNERNILKHKHKKKCKIVRGKS